MPQHSNPNRKVHGDVKGIIVHSHEAKNKDVHRPAFSQPNGGNWTLPRRGAWSPELHEQTEKQVSKY